MRANRKTGRNIDRNGDRSSCIRPFAGLTERLAEHFGGEPMDHCRAFGERYELDRHDESPFRVLPADQSLHAAQLAGLGVDLWLIVQNQLAIADSPAQFNRYGCDHANVVRPPC